MVKFTAVDGKGKTIVFLGLSQANLDALPHDLPIVVELAGLGLPPMDIVIFAGKDEGSMMEDLIRVGAIREETKLDIDPRTLLE